MKLFKKLAAIALAAVLALSMVGCGTGSALDLKNEVLNAIEDSKRRECYGERTSAKQRYRRLHCDL